MFGSFSLCNQKYGVSYIDDRYLTTIHDKPESIEEPTPILYHTRLFQDRKFRSLCFHVIESKQTETGTPLTYVLEPKEYPFLEFLRKKPLKKSSDVEKLKVRERYSPPLPMRFDSSMFRESCGLGFDASTNTLKMVCVLLKDHGAVPSKDHDMVRKNLCTMVHEIGTNSWREIPQVPPYHITDGAVFCKWMVVALAANGSTKWMLDSVGFVSDPLDMYQSRKKAYSWRTFVLVYGVVSNEYWTIVDVSEDFRWGLFLYSGVTRVAGQSYTVQWIG
ncbi:hypothetical protein Tco_0620790 [Tanacetum coccineum]